MLITMEIKKLLTKASVALFSLVILYKLFTAFVLPGHSYEFSTQVYSNYISTLSSMSQTEQEQFIGDEIARFESIFADTENMQQKYNNGEITIDEFSEYNVSLTTAAHEKPAFDEIYSKYKYFNNLTARGKTPEYFYDLNTIDYLSSLQSPDFLLIFFIIFIIVNLLSLDKECKMHEMIAASTFGRWKQLKSQLVAAVTVVGVGALLASVADFLLFFQKNDFEFLSKQLYSMESFGECKYDFTILQYILLVFSIKILWSLVLALFVFVVHCFVDNKLSSVFILASAIFLPVLLEDVIASPYANIFIGIQLSGVAVLENSMFISVLTAMITSVFFYVLLYKRKKDSL